MASQTIANLCERLGITKGSFYHHFTSLADFRQQLVAFWEAAQETALDSTAPGGVGEWVAAAHDRADAAVRAWSQSDEAVAEAQARVDALRLRAVSKELRAAGVPADRARSLASLGLALVIGSQTAGSALDRRTRKGLVDEYRRAVDAAVAESKPKGRRKA